MTVAVRRSSDRANNKARSTAIYFNRRKNMADTREGEAAGTARTWTDKAGNQAKGTTQEAGAKAKEATAGMLENVKDKVQDVAAGASELVGKAKDTAQEWASSVGDAAVQVKDKAQAVAGFAVENVRAAEQDVTAFIRRYPLPALLVGFGVGFLLGQVLRRRSSGAG
jgi:ElaB/YqjD/DUF883 family membrane-anchored ribosome-binding protein